MNANKRNEYITYARTFENYKWFKTIFVIILTIGLANLITITATFGGMLYEELAGGGTGIYDIAGGYDNFNVYSALGAFLGLGSVAIYIPTLFLASKIVKDRPFDSYISVRKGWDKGIFFKALGIGVLTIGLPLMIQTLLVDGRTGGTKFTAIGLILCLVLTPIQCCAEEFFFRGLLMQAFGAWFKKPAVAIVLQAICFAAVHPYDNVGRVVILSLGLIFGILTWYAKGIEAGCALHIVTDVTIFILTGFGFGEVQTKTDIPSSIFQIGITLAYVLVLVIVDRKYNILKRNKVSND